MQIDRQWIKSELLERRRFRRFNERYPALFDRLIDRTIEESEHVDLAGDIDDEREELRARIVESFAGDDEFRGIETILLNMLIGWLVKLAITKLIDSIL